MAQAIEAKLRKISKSEKHFEHAKSELDANEKGHAKKKLDVICELASKLEEEGEIETNRISTEIAKRLGEYVTQRYVNEVLDVRYKDEKHAESAKSRRTSSAKTKQTVQNADVSNAEILDKNEQPPQKQEAARKESVEHNKQDALTLESSELKKALRRLTPLVTADQISANEITFIVPRKSSIN